MAGTLSRVETLFFRSQEKGRFQSTSLTARLCLIPRQQVVVEFQRKSVCGLEDVGEKRDILPIK